MPVQNAATILKPLVPKPHSTPLHMAQHVADWVAPFPLNQHSPPPPLKFLYTSPSPPPSPSPLRARELGAIIIVILDVSEK